ncbi:MAG TPA: ribosome silencing factor [Bryobacteraceae bacterium]|nr:ribosome silencing factor [Bryobacteraceae bacterium]
MRLPPADLAENAGLAVVSCLSSLSRGAAHNLRRHWRWRGYPSAKHPARPRWHPSGIPCSTIRTGQEQHLTKADLNVSPDTQTADPTWLIAVRAAESKKAADIKVLDLTGITSFADFFVICTGANARQVQAISDEVHLQLKRQAGELPISLEGYNQAEWVLADYGDLLVHIFSPKAHEYYGLERLWRSAKTVQVPAE